MEKKLTDKQQLFVEEYLANGFNATDAYRKAYNVEKANHAYRIFNQPAVKEEIAKRLKEKHETLNITADRVMEELATIAFAKKGDKDYNANAKLKALDLLQKQLGLQTQKIQADVNTDIVINIGE